MTLENSLYSVSYNPFHKIIEVPTSKSYANRALILCALKGNAACVNAVSNSTDVTHLLDAFQKIGLIFSNKNGSITFTNSFPECENLLQTDEIDLYTGDGGTTNRFLIALLSLGKKTYRLFPTEKMRERPIDDLISPLKELGVKIVKPKTGPWLVLSGPVESNQTKTIKVDCQKSTQFASALLLAFHHFKNINFEFINLVSSQKYLQMTGELLQKNTFTVPVDFSSLSYPLALALTSGSVLVKNCIGIDFSQADSCFIELILKHGGDLSWTPEGLKVTSRLSLSPFSINGSHCPDLVPTLAFLASKIEGESRISDLEVLKYKESNRIEELLKLLKAFSVNHEYINETSTLIIRGSQEKLKKISYTSARDHRLVMTAYLFMRANNGGELGNSDCVKKSYPNFLESLL